MQKIYKTLSIFLSIAALLSACQNKLVNEPEEVIELEEAIILENNAFLAHEEKFRVERFVERSPLPFRALGNGLFMHTTRRGIGAFIQEEDRVVLDHKMRGLDGTFYYQSPFEAPLLLKVGKQDLPYGLHEALLRLQLGSKATLILPSHLAYGLLGDRDKIPFRMPIVWEIHVLRVVREP